LLCGAVMMLDVVERLPLGVCVTEELVETSSFPERGRL
jgi:hypothetical protein